jgi:hypothetical protein
MSIVEAAMVAETLAATAETLAAASENSHIWGQLGRWNDTRLHPYTPRDRIL